jgi:hypothetical protein
MTGELWRSAVEGDYQANAGGWMANEINGKRAKDENQPIKTAICPSTAGRLKPPPFYDIYQLTGDFKFCYTE